MSSDFGSYKFDFDNINYIYAGAQKNMGIPGVTVCIVKDSFLTDDENPNYLNLKKLTNVLNDGGFSKVEMTYKTASNMVIEARI